MSTTSRFSGDSGIAIGPILFVIAILAVLAAAIAAGSGSFTGRTTQESSKIMASTILQNIDDVETAVKLIEANGYTYQQVSFEIPSSGLTQFANGSDGQSQTVNALCTDDACKVFMSDGGGVVATAWPLQAFDLGAVQNVLGGAALCLASTERCRYAYLQAQPMHIDGLGSSADYRFGVDVEGIDQNVCMQINNLTGVSNPDNVPPAGPDIITSIPHVQGLGFDSRFGSHPLRFSGALISGKTGFCYYDGTVYSYVHEFFD